MASSLLRTTVPSSTPSISRFTLSSSTSRRSVHRLVKYNYDPLKGHGKFLGKHSLKVIIIPLIPYTSRTTLTGPPSRIFCSV
jgi:hypothetical protein